MATGTISPPTLSPASVPTPSDLLRTSLSTSAAASPPSVTHAESSRSKGMHLGANRTLPGHLASQIMSEEGLDEEGLNPWGNDDLMDINADEGDWCMSFLSQHEVRD